MAETKACACLERRWSVNNIGTMTWGRVVYCTLGVDGYDEEALCIKG